MGRSTADIFRRQLQAAKSSGVDLLIHTGDLVNCPSPASVAIVTAAIAESGSPHLYISGNHDWQFDGLSAAHPEATPEQLRQTWIHEKGHLLPMYRTAAGEQLDPLCWSQDIAGLRIIGIDNSTMQVTTTQLAFFEQALATAPGAVLLLCHVPLFTPELLSAMQSRGLPNAGSYLCGDPDSSNPSYQPTPSTLAFIRSVRSEDSKVIGVLAGHIHTPQAHKLRGEWAKLAAGPMPCCLGCMQYTTDAGCFGGSREIQLEPIDSEFSQSFVADMARRQSFFVEQVRLASSPKL
jgi:predicted phosphodiesterase